MRKRYLPIISGAIAAWLCFAFIQPLLDGIGPLRPFLQRFEYVGVQASTMFMYQPTSSEGTGTTPAGVTCGNSTNGSWIQFFASTSKPTWEIVLSLTPNATTGGSFDVGTGGSGSETPILRQVSIESNSAVGPSEIFQFSVFIPSSTRIAARCYGVGATPVVTTSITPMER